MKTFFHILVIILMLTVIPYCGGYFLFGTLVEKGYLTLSFGIFFAAFHGIGWGLLAAKYKEKFLD